MIGFPMGPYGLATRFIVYRWLGILGSALAAVACIVGYGYMGWGYVSAILHDHQVWNGGGPELPASVEGKVTTRQFVLKSYDLQVTYRVPDGGRRQKKLEVVTLFSGLNADGDLTVRLLPQDPDDYALSAAVEASGGRWAGAAFFGVVGILLLGGTCSFLTFTLSRQWMRATRAARTGVPVTCALLKRESILHQGRPTGSETFTFKVPPAAAGGVETEVTYQMKTAGSDALTLGGGNSVLAIVPSEAPKDAILLLRNYYPLALSDSQRLQAEATVAGRT